MNVAFATTQAYDFDRHAVSFPVNGKRVVCRILVEAIVLV